MVLAARSIDSSTGKPVIYHYKTTTLLKSQERLAYQLSRLWLQDYYLTYPQLTVEDEVRTALHDGDQFINGPSPLLRDSASNPARGFVVTDRNYLSARWPGDAYKFSQTFLRMLNHGRP